MWLPRWEGSRGGLYWWPQTTPIVMCAAMCVQNTAVHFSLKDKNVIPDSSSVRAWQSDHSRKGMRTAVACRISLKLNNYSSAKSWSAWENVYWIGFGIKFDKPVSVAALLKLSYLLVRRHHAAVLQWEGCFRGGSLHVLLGAIKSCHDFVVGDYKSAAATYCSPAYWCDGDIAQWAHIKISAAYVKCPLCTYGLNIQHLTNKRVTNSYNGALTSATE